LAQQKKESKMPKYPNITITLPQNADNATIVLACLKAMKTNNLGNKLDEFVRDLGKSDPTHLRQIAKKWFNVE